MDKKEKKSLIEALLFVSGEPITTAQIKSVSDIDEAEIKQLIEEMISEYKERNSGILLYEIAGGFSFMTNPAFVPWIKKLTQTSGANKLSIPALETLAIIAYNQPIIKADIEQIRGVNSDGVMKTLLDRRLIKIMGRKEVPGKPLMYGTTREFLQYFGLKDLSDLPTVKDLAREEAA